MATRSIRYIVTHGLWRAVAALFIIVVPMYLWLLFYPFATGVYTQSPELIRMNAPFLATLVVPFLFAIWILGFKRWAFAAVFLLTIIITQWLPFGVASQLLPGSYLRLAIVLLLVAMGVRAFLYWRDYHVHQLPIDRYSVSACIVIGAVSALLLVGLLLPSNVML